PHSAPHSFPTRRSSDLNVVTLGDGTETAVAQQPHDIEFEWCYIHGDPTVGSRRGVAMNGGNLKVLASHLSDFKEVGADSQALAGDRKSTRLNSSHQIIS